MGAVDAPEPLTPFEIDVELQPSAAQLWFRDVETRACWHGIFPRPGECNISADPADATCGLTLTCLRRVAIERDGVVLGEAEVVPSHVLSIQAPPTDGPSELVIDGCGASQRIPLPAASTAVPALTDVWTNGGAVLGTLMSVTGASSTMASMQDRLGDRMVCHEADPSTWRVFVSGSLGDLTVASVTASAPLDTPWGRAYVWSIASRMPQRIVIPGSYGTEWQINPETSPTWSLLKDGSPTSLGATSWTWRYVETAAGPRHRLNGGTVTYNAGESTDTMSVLFLQGGGYWTGSFPHVVPTNEVEFSAADDGLFELVVGPVTLTSNSTPTTTAAFTLTMTWNHPLVARVMQ
jgi:hypothetical protein